MPSILRKIKTKHVSLLLAFIVIALFYTNCGGEFHTLDVTAQNLASKNPAGSSAGTDTDNNLNNSDSNLPAATEIGLSVANITIKQGEQAEFEIKIASAKNESITIEYETLDNTAIKGSDYKEQKSSVVIAAGSTSVKIKISTLANSLLKSVKEFRLKTIAKMNTLTESVTAIAQLQPNTALFYPKKLVSGPTYISQNCVITAQDTVKCWSNSTSVIAIAGLTGVKDIAIGQFHTCVVTSQNTVKCWGDNNYGQLGNRTTTPSSVPVDVFGVSNVKSIAAGFQHTCALLQTGTVMCWGHADALELGVFSQELAKDNTHISSTAVAVPDLNNITEIIVGGYSSCAISSQHVVKCWGFNGSGTLTTYLVGNNFLQAIEIDNFSKSKQFSIGWESSCFVNDQGSVVCQSIQPRETSYQKNLFPGYEKVQYVSTGLGLTCILTAQNKAVCTYYSSGTLIQVSNLDDVKTLTTSCALTNAGIVKCFTGGNTTLTAIEITGI